MNVVDYKNYDKNKLTSKRKSFVSVQNESLPLALV